jgi:hypothetical protein
MWYVPGTYIYKFKFKTVYGELCSYVRGTWILTLRPSATNQTNEAKTTSQNQPRQSRKQPSRVVLWPSQDSIDKHYFWVRLTEFGYRYQKKHVPTNIRISCPSWYSNPSTYCEGDKSGRKEQPRRHTAINQDSSTTIYL